ncbi:MAG: urease accessory protein UreE [Corynebacterium sp.]|nr:urease accessory protein UreE [Corynebacterium sp.]
MLITAVIGNIYEDFHPGDRHRETIYLSSAALLQRIQRLRTDHDTEVGLRLPRQAPALRDGDVLFADDAQYFLVQVISSEVLIISPHSGKDMLFVAHSLGNRHLPAQFFDEHSEFGNFAQAVMVVAYDHTVQDFLDQHQIPYERTELTLPKPFRHAEHTH